MLLSLSNWTVAMLSLLLLSANGQPMEPEVSTRCVETSLGDSSALFRGQPTD